VLGQSSPSTRREIRTGTGLRTANSPPNAPRLGSWGGEPFEIALGHAASVAQLYVFAILQHLDALSVLFESDPPPAYAIGLVARSVVEVGARARWIMGPDVTAEVRIALDERDFPRCAVMGRQLSRPQATTSSR
jgi:hypothetical protein